MYFGVMISIRPAIIIVCFFIIVYAFTKTLFWIVEKLDYFTYWVGDVMIKRMSSEILKLTKRKHQKRYKHLHLLSDYSIHLVKSPKLKKKYDRITLLDEYYKKILRHERNSQRKTKIACHIKNTGCVHNETNKKTRVTREAQRSLLHELHSLENKGFTIYSPKEFANRLRSKENWEIRNEPIFNAQVGFNSNNIHSSVCGDETNHVNDSLLSVKDFGGEHFHDRIANDLLVYSDTESQNGNCHSEILHKKNEDQRNIKENNKVQYNKRKYRTKSNSKTLVILKMFTVEKLLNFSVSQKEDTKKTRLNGYKMFNIINTAKKYSRLFTEEEKKVFLGNAIGPVMTLKRRLGNRVDLQKGKFNRNNNSQVSVTEQRYSQTRRHKLIHFKLLSSINVLWSNQVGTHLKSYVLREEELYRLFSRNMSDLLTANKRVRTSLKLYTRPSYNVRKEISEILLDLKIGKHSCSKNNFRNHYGNEMFSKSVVKHRSKCRSHICYCIENSINVPDNSVKSVKHSATKELLSNVTCDSLVDKITEIRDDECVGDEQGTQKVIAKGTTYNEKSKDPLSHISDKPKPYLRSNTISSFDIGLKAKNIPITLTLLEDEDFDYKLIGLKERIRKSKAIRHPIKSTITSSIIETKAKLSASSDDIVKKEDSISKNKSLTRIKSKSKIPLRNFSTNNVRSHIKQLHKSESCLELKNNQKENINVFKETSSERPKQSKKNLSDIKASQKDKALKLTCGSQENNIITHSKSRIPQILVLSRKVEVSSSKTMNENKQIENENKKKPDKQLKERDENKSPSKNLRNLETYKKIKSPERKQAKCSELKVVTDNSLKTPKKRFKRSIKITNENTTLGETNNTNTQSMANEEMLNSACSSINKTLKNITFSLHDISPVECAVSLKNLCSKDKNSVIVNNYNQKDDINKQTKVSCSFVSHHLSRVNKHKVYMRSDSLSTSLINPSNEIRKRTRNSIEIVSNNFVTKCSKMEKRICRKQTVFRKLNYTSLLNYVVYNVNHVTEVSNVNYISNRSESFTSPCRRLFKILEESNEERKDTEDLYNAHIEEIRETKSVAESLIKQINTESLMKKIEERCKLFEKMNDDEIFHERIILRKYTPYLKQSNFKKSESCLKEYKNERWLGGKCMNQKTKNNSVQNCSKTSLVSSKVETYRTHNKTSINPKEPKRDWLIEEVCNVHSNELMPASKQSKFVTHPKSKRMPLREYLRRYSCNVGSIKGVQDKCDLHIYPVLLEEQ